MCIYEAITCNHGSPIIADHSVYIAEISSATAFFFVLDKFQGDYLSLQPNFQRRRNMHQAQLVLEVMETCFLVAYRTKEWRGRRVNGSLSLVSLSKKSLPFNSGPIRRLGFRFQDKDQKVRLPISRQTLDTCLNVFRTSVSRCD